ncbi:hypothetical protein ACHAXM_007531 [Skeletonema potamos]
MMIRCFCFTWLHIVVFVFFTITCDVVVVVESFTTPLTGKKTNSVSQRIETDSFHLHERSAASAAETPLREEIRYIAGRRALLLHPKSPSSKNTSYPPIIILGGMAQSITSWEFHLPHFANDRSVLIYECLGQGPLPPDGICSNVDLDAYYDDVSLKRQGSDFWNVVDEAFFTPGSYYHDNNNIATTEDGGNVQVVDVVGFSFGGRVAMAAAVSQPNRIRRLHLTGVGAERDEYANVILASWREMLGANDKLDITSDKEKTNDSRLRAFAWSIILATYSEQFLASVGAARVLSWVDGVCKFNTQSGLRAILMQTHGGEGQWTPASMAEQMKGSVDFKLVVGSQDKMASPEQVFRLAQLLEQHDEIKDKEDECYKVIENCGHAVPFEAMRLWREDVIKYLT